MIFSKKLKSDIKIYSEMAITVLSVPTIITTGIIAQIIVIWLSAQEQLFPGAEAFQSILATCSEIIAGLYGTTLAGYTFFLSRIDALTATDTTLDYVVASIKTRFKYLIWYITFNVLNTLFISILLMYIPAPDGENISYIYRLVCNEFVLFLVFSIVLILYYSIQVINPNCIGKEAALLKKKMSHTGPDGNTASFIAMYDRIENICSSLLPADVLRCVRGNKGKRFEFTVELLSEQQLLEPELILDLTRIHRYYECVINCTPLSVTEEMCLRAQHVLTYLENTTGFVLQNADTAVHAE